MIDVDLTLALKLAGAGLVLLAFGFMSGHMTAPAFDTEYVIGADKARQASIEKCQKGFEEATTLLRNTNETAFHRMEAEREAAFAELRKSHQEDIALMKLAVAGCESSKGVAH